jgi:hypothetical protein
MVVTKIRPAVRKLAMPDIYDINNTSLQRDVLKRSKFFQIFISTFPPLVYINQAALGPGIYSASNRNEYQKQKNVSGKLSAAVA